MHYLIIKSLHVVSVISWFAGLLYIVRLFIYHQEANLSQIEGDQKTLQKQFSLMERRLWAGITTPAMIASLVFGFWMLSIMPGKIYWAAPWMHLKLAFVLFLLVYHYLCGSIRKKLIHENLQWSSKKLRVFNEIGTLLLFGIVFSVITRDIGTVFKSIIIATVIGAIIFKVYSAVRRKKSAKL